MQGQKRIIANPAVDWMGCADCGLSVREMDILGLHHCGCFVLRALMNKWRQDIKRRLARKAA